MPRSFQVWTRSGNVSASVPSFTRRSREFDTRESKGPILGALGRSDFARVRYCSRIACKSR